MKKAGVRQGLFRLPEYAVLSVFGEEWSMSLKPVQIRPVRKKGRALVNFRKNWQYLLLCAPSVIGYIFFHFVPLAGIIMPFAKYTYRDGIFGSKWVSMKNFTTLFRSPAFGKLIRNTVSYSTSFIIIGHVIAIFTALMLYELSGKKLKKLYQTSMMIPNFLSWVIVGYVTYAILHPSFGFLRQIRDAMGLPYYDVYTDPTWWPLILTLTAIWKGMNGYLTYYACLMGIDPTLFEAAVIDGATRWQQRRYVALPALVPLITLFLISAVAGIFSNDFGLFYIIPRNVGLLYETTDVINTYVYRGLQNGSFLQSSAIGLMQSAIGTILLITTNAIVRKVSPENSMF